MLGQHLSSAGADPALANMQVIMQLVEGREKEREDILFERETEYLYLRQPIHGGGVCWWVGDLYEEGNRTPVRKETHSRNWGEPFPFPASGTVTPDFQVPNPYTSSSSTHPMPDVCT